MIITKSRSRLTTRWPSRLSTPRFNQKAACYNQKFGLFHKWNNDHNDHKQNPVQANNWVGWSFECSNILLKNSLLWLKIAHGFLINAIRIIVILTKSWSRLTVGYSFEVQSNNWVSWWFKCSMIQYWKTACYDQKLRVVFINSIRSMVIITKSRFRLTT